MKKINATAAVFAALVLSGAAQAAPAGVGAWNCSVPGMVSGQYDGGSSAYIHLSAFSTGGHYSVQKSGKKATGTTANGTRFTCTQK